MTHPYAHKKVEYGSGRNKLPSRADVGTPRLCVSGSLLVFSTTV